MNSLVMLYVNKIINSEITNIKKVPTLVRAKVVVELEKLGISTTDDGTIILVEEEVVA